MKSVLIIRHAKSSWDISVLKDFDRPLNERGHRDALMMAKKIFSKEIIIDAFISSTANRALTTCKYFAEVYGKKEKEIILLPELYHAATDTFYKVISAVDDKHKSIALFSHNPGITAFVNELTDMQIDNMPTCGIFAVQAEIQHWEGFKKATKKLLFFDYPKSDAL